MVIEMWRDDVTVVLVGQLRAMEVLDVKTLLLTLLLSKIVELVMALKMSVFGNGKLRT